MKNVFRTFLTAAAVFVTLGAAAQEDPSKETVIINPFACTDAVSQAACDNMRAAVLSGFSDRGRFHIVDALTDETLSKLYADRNAEDVVNDANWKSESEAAYKALGAKKVVIGQANNVSFSTFKSDIDGKMYNKAEVTLALKVYNIIDGAMVGSETIAVTGVDALHFSARGMRPSGMAYRNPQISMGGCPGVPEYASPCADERTIRQILNELNR